MIGFWTKKLWGVSTLSRRTSFKNQGLSSLSLRQRAVVWVLSRLISHLCSGVVSALPDKNHPGKKLRLLKPWLPTLHNHFFFPRNRWRPAQPALPKAWHGAGCTSPKKLSPLAVRVRPNQMPYVGCLYHHPCCLWIPRLLCFPLGMHPQVHVIKSLLWCTLWRETRISS